MTNYPLEWGWHTSDPSKPSEEQSRNTLLGKRTSDAGDTELAAAGDLWCEVCPGGGTRGMTAMYRIDGLQMCRDCAVKDRKIEALPGRQQNEILEEYELK